MEVDQVLSDLLDTPQGSFLSHVRRALAADQQRVKAFLGGLEGLEFGGKPTTPVLRSGLPGATSKA